MKLTLAALLIMMSPFANAAAAETDYKSVKCPAADVIAKSYLEIETAGFRIAGQCVNEAAYPFLSLGQPPRGSEDGVPSKIEIASEKTPFTIEKISQINASHYVVRLHYTLQSGAQIKDSLEFDTLEGPMKDRVGCALLAVEPKHLVVRPKCRN